jgi:hypothetical protein
MSDKRYFGKYRGTVLNNVDPMMMGRIQAIVPDVTGLLPSSWAMPCFQVAGIQNGVFAVPIVGSAVWIELNKAIPIIRSGSDAFTAVRRKCRRWR